MERWNREAWQYIPVLKTEIIYKSPIWLQAKDHPVILQVEEYGIQENFDKRDNL
jgi:hypothetical protein